MRDLSCIVAASESLRHGARGRENDNRVGAKHSRMNRGKVRKMYQSVEITFYPLKQWPAVIGVSSVTLRHWIKREILRVYIMHDMPVMCLAEMHSVHRVVTKWRSIVDMHNAVDPVFCRELQETLNETRTALDTLMRGRALTPHQKTLLHSSLEGPHAATKTSDPKAHH